MIQISPRSCYSRASDLALPLALIAMGGNLSSEKIRKDYKATAFASFCKLFPMVLLGWLLLAWLDAGGLDFKVGIVLLACPTAFPLISFPQNLEPTRV